MAGWDFPPNSLGLNDLAGRLLPPAAQAYAQGPQESVPRTYSGAAAPRAFALPEVHPQVYTRQWHKAPAGVALPVALDLVHLQDPDFEIFLCAQRALFYYYANLSRDMLSIHHCFRNNRNVQIFMAPLLAERPQLEAFRPYALLKARELVDAVMANDTFAL